MNKGSAEQIVYSELALAELWRSATNTVSYLLKKWWIVGLIGLIAGLVGIYIAWKEKPKYQSRLTFALEESGGGLGSALSLAAEFGLNLGSGKDVFQGENIVSIFTSRRMIERVLLSPDTLNGKVETFANRYMAINRENKKQTVRLNNVTFPADQPRADFSYLQDSILNNLYLNITKFDLVVQKPDKKLDIYEIGFTSGDERFTKEFTERLVKETTEFYTELRSKRSRETLEILEARVSQLKGSLNNAISDRSAIQDANINPAFAAAQAAVQRKQIDISTFGGAYGELYKNLELARYQYLKSIPLLQVIDEPLYPMKKIKKGKLITGLFFAVIASLLTVLVLLIRRQIKRTGTLHSAGV